MFCPAGGPRIVISSGSPRGPVGARVVALISSGGRIPVGLRDFSGNPRDFSEIA